MNGNQPLSATLLAGMAGQRAAPAQPPAQPPQGGLGAMAPMAKQSTDVALQAINRDEYQLPALQGAADIGQRQYQQMLMAQLNASLPSAQEMQRARMARGLMLQNVLSRLEPRERSGLDTMAAGVTSVENPITDANLGASLAAMGRGAVSSKQAFEDRELAKAKTAYDILDRDISQQQDTALNALGKMRALSGAGMPEFTLPDGTPVYKSGTRLFYIGDDGRPVEWLGAEKTIIGGDTLYGRRADMVKTLALQYLERGDYATLEEATRAAQAEADRIMAKVNKQTGVQPRPSTPAAGTPEIKPSTERRPAQPAAAFELEASSPEAYDMLRQKIAERSRAGDRQAVTALQNEMAKQFPQGRPTGSGMPKKDTRLEGFKKTYGEKEAATLEKALTESSELFSNNAGLVSTLNTLEGVLSLPEMPEGEFAKAFVTVQSALKSLGFDIGEVTGPAQVANALANEMSLRLRTGSGQNLMPGQMSNFDAQLLMSMAPNLSQTKEGRQMLIEVMRDMAQSRMRMAQEAQNFAKGHGGMLTPEWREHATTLEKREMARRELKRREIMKKFGGSR